MWEMILKMICKTELSLTKTKREGPSRWKVRWWKVRKKWVLDSVCMICVILDERKVGFELSMSQTLREVEEIVRVPFWFQLFKSIDTTSVVSFWPISLLVVDVVYVGTLFCPHRASKSVKDFEGIHQQRNVATEIQTHPITVWRRVLCRVDHVLESSKDSILLTVIVIWK